MNQKRGESATLFYALPHVCAINQNPAEDSLRSDLAASYHPSGLLIAFAWEGEKPCQEIMTRSKIEPAFLQIAATQGGE